MTYKRFYKLFNRLPLHDDEMKERLVQQYTCLLYTSPSPRDTR